MQGAHRAHLLGGRVIRVQVPCADEALCQVEQLREVVAGVRHALVADAQRLDVCQDVVYKLLLLLRRARKDVTCLAARDAQTEADQKPRVIAVM